MPRRLPVAWTQLGHPRAGHFRQPGENIGEPGLRIDFVHLGRDDQRIHECSAVAAVLVAGEEPGFPTEDRGGWGNLKSRDEWIFRATAA